VISVFDEDELDFIMSGVPVISLEDWKAHTTYKGELSANHKTIKWFWEILGTLKQDELRKFLLFCTGMPRVPIEGFR
jgi:E3 ubiquitin-protein ligase HUWE1